MPPAAERGGAGERVGQRRPGPARGEQQGEARRRVAQGGAGTGEAAPRRKGEAREAQRQQDRRRRDREPHRIIIRRQGRGRGYVEPALEQGVPPGRVVGERRRGVDEGAGAVLPHVGRYGVEDPRPARRERGERSEDAPPRRGVGGERQIENPRRGDRGQEGQPDRDAHVGQHGGRGAAEQERPRPAAEECAMGEPETDGEQREGGDVLGVEERVGVEAWLEDEQRQGEEGRDGGPGHAPREEGAAQRAGEEEDVARGVAEQMDVARVAEAQRLLGEQDRQVEDDAVKPVVGVGRPEVELAFANYVAPIDLGAPEPRDLVEGDPVIVEDGRADGGEDGASGEEGAKAPGPARHRRPPPVRSISPSHRLRHPPPPSGTICPVRTRRMG